MIPAALQVPRRTRGPGNPPPIRPRAWEKRADSISRIPFPDCSVAPAQPRFPAPRADQKKPLSWPPGFSGTAPANSVPPCACRTADGRRGCRPWPHVSDNLPGPGIGRHWLPRPGSPAARPGAGRVARIRFPGSGRCAVVRSRSAGQTGASIPRPVAGPGWDGC